MAGLCAGGIIVECDEDGNVGPALYRLTYLVAQDFRGCVQCGQSCERWFEGQWDGRGGHRVCELVSQVVAVKWYPEYWTRSGTPGSRCEIVRDVVPQVLDVRLVWCVWTVTLGTDCETGIPSTECEMSLRCDTSGT